MIDMVETALPLTETVPRDRHNPVGGQRVAFPASAFREMPRKPFSEKLNPFLLQQRDGTHQSAFIDAEARRSEIETFTAGSPGRVRGPWVISLAKFPGAPHSSQASAGKRSNEERRSLPRGKRLASGRN